jgi:hypothetical protein
MHEVPTARGGRDPCARTGSTATVRTQFIHNHVVEVDGDVGTGTSYLEAKTVSKGMAYPVAGRYRDTYRRTSAGWRFARMEFEPLFTLPFDESWASDDRLKMGR